MRQTLASFSGKVKQRQPNLRRELNILVHSATNESKIVLCHFPLPLFSCGLVPQFMGVHSN